MTTFHQIQALGKKTVTMLFKVITGGCYDTIPTNYLKLCSQVYQAFKRGNSKALKHIPTMIQYQKYERIDQLNAAFAL
jgi:hypothetical protein